MTEYLFAGLLDLPAWVLVLIALGLTHITIIAVTVFLHRNQAHRSVGLHPTVSHFFRFWLWLTTGMITKEWSAIHRKHHAKVESPDDPHSPQVLGILAVLFAGAFLYRKESLNRETIEKYGYGAPDDWLERNLYTKRNWLGILIMLSANMFLFGGIPGLLIWLTQMVWIPFWAAGVINGIGHFFGYRNFQTADESRNIVPWAIVIGGEELHNNHHAYPTSPKLSRRWYEFDVGWFYIRLLQMAGLARIKRIPTMLENNASRAICDLDTFHAIIENRFDVLARFGNKLRRTCVDELARLRINKQGWTMPTSNTLKKWLSMRESRIDKVELENIRQAISASSLLSRVENMKRELVSLWEDREASAEQLLERMREWCRTAEASGIEALQTFSQELRGFSSSRKKFV